MKHGSQIRLALLTIALLSIADLFSQTAIPVNNTQGKTSSPVDVVLAYVDAANRHDLEGFLALYSPGIKKYQFPATLASSGIDHMRKVYTKSFAEKNEIHIEVRSMIALGDKVISHDHVTGLPDGAEADETVVYQVEKGLITNMVYLDRITTKAEKEINL